MNDAVKPFWIQVTEEHLAKGDLVEGCLVPFFEPDFGTSEVTEVPVKGARLIVVTQTCDLVNDKASLVAMCPIHTLDEFEDGNPNFKKKGRWEEVRKGRVEGLHLLASPNNPADNRGALVADFGQIFSLPPIYVKGRVAVAAPRVASRFAVPGTLFAVLCAIFHARRSAINHSTI